MKNYLAVSVCAMMLVGCEAAEKASDKPVATVLTSGINVENIDKSVRPQDDFYRYVNGAWLKTAQIPGDKTSWGGFGILRDDSEKNQRTIVEALSIRDDLEAGTEEQKVGDMFASFMNVDAVNATGSEPVKGFIDQLNAVEDIKGFMTFTASMSEFSISSPLGIAIFGDLGDSTRYLTYVFQGGLILPDRDYYLKDDDSYTVMLEAYPKYLEKLYALSGIEDGAAKAGAVLEFETALAKIQWSSQEMRDIPRLYNKFNVSDLSEKVTGSVDWDAFFNAAHLGDIKEIVVAQPDYVKALLSLLNSTDISTLKAYYAAHILNDSAAYLSQDFINASQDFNGEVVAGRKELPARWQRGVRLVNSQIGEAVGKVYVDKYFPAVAKERMDVLVANLIKAFGESIDNLDWMTDETKAKAQDKRNRFMTKIGYPDTWRDYSTLNIERSDLFGNVMRARQFEHMRVVKQLQGPMDRTEWGMTPQTVNAYHNPVLNEIVFPAAILQPPFFNVDAEDAVNYGGIGAVIGHEIGHAFDDNGRRFDGHGNLNDWWTKEDAEAFDKAASRLVDQYNQLEALPGLNVNGQLTLGENIGDLTGATLGWRAYLLSLNGAEPPVVDGFTAKERYLMGFAQIWRNIYTDEALRARVVADPHAPSEFRANATLRNFPMFMEVYGVKEGDGMYLPPEERVKIW